LIVALGLKKYFKVSQCAFTNSQRVKVLMKWAMAVTASVPN
jgi:hypothetical protein